MLKYCVMAGFLLVSANAVAKDNAFKADMSNPTICAAITEFEQVCFPFISHETELSAAQNREVFQSRMVEAGYKFGEEKEWRGMTPTGIKYAPTSCPKGSLPIAASRKVEGKFTVFPASGRYRDLDLGKSSIYVYDGQNKVVQSSGTIIGPLCEVLTVSMEVTRQTYYTQQRYENRITPISAYLTWQKVPDITKQVIHAKKNSFSRNSYKRFKVRSSFPPASACAIHIDDKGLTADIIENAVIKHDSNWKSRDIKSSIGKEISPDAYSWSQCTQQNGENYLYGANLIGGVFSLSVEVLQDEEYAQSYGCKTHSGN